jgi:hypothetical protein
MKIRIRPTAFVVSALTGTVRAGFAVESTATAALMTQIQVPVEKFANVATLKPYLNVVVDGGNESLLVSARFKYFRENSLLHTTEVIGRRCLDTLTFEPVSLVDLRQYQRGGGLAGDWKITAEAAVLPFSLLSQMDEVIFYQYMNAQRFNQLAAFDIVFYEDGAEVELTPTGRMVLGRSEQDMGQTFNVDEY